MGVWTFLDLNGELLGEYKDDGTLFKEYVYFNGQPVALYSQETTSEQPADIELILDNDQTGTSSTGSWDLKTDPQQYGSDYREAKKKASNTYRWSATPPGITYNVYAWWDGGNGYSSQVEYTIGYGLGQTDTVVKDQRSGGGQWQLLGQYYSTDGSDYVEVNAANGKTSADAIKWAHTPEPIVTVTETTSFIHTDQLGTPRAVTDSNQTVIWRWDSTPFGDSAPNEDPDGDGNTLTLNLRFPGQYYDAESGLSYNYFRNYDPTTGRYVESDPAGLIGGINTFAYVLGNPVRYIDFLGLVGESKKTCTYKGTEWFDPVRDIQSHWEVIFHRAFPIALPKLKQPCYLQPEFGTIVWVPTCAMEGWTIWEHVKLSKKTILEVIIQEGEAHYECVDNCTGEKTDEFIETSMDPIINTLGVYYYPELWWDSNPSTSD